MSPRIDFYVIDQHDDRAREHLSCRLAEKAWSSGHHVFVLADSPVAAERLDELLWTFRDESFLPHALTLPGQPLPDPREAPIVVGAGEIATSARDVLINLTDDVPLAYAQFARIAEIVDASDSSRSAGRQRFRYYRDHECDVHTHNI